MDGRMDVVSLPETISRDSLVTSWYRRRDTSRCRVESCRRGTAKYLPSCHEEDAGQRIQSARLFCVPSSPLEENPQICHNCGGLFRSFLSTTPPNATAYELQAFSVPRPHDRIHPTDTHRILWQVSREYTDLCSSQRPEQRPPWDEQTETLEAGESNKQQAIHPLGQRLTCKRKRERERASERASEREREREICKITKIINTNLIYISFFAFSNFSNISR